MAKVRGKIIVRNGKKIFVPVGNEVDTDIEATTEPAVHRKVFHQTLPPHTVIRRSMSARPEVLKDVRYVDAEELWHKSVIEFFRTDPGDDPRKSYDEANIKMEMKITGLQFSFQPDTWEVPSNSAQDDYFYDLYQSLRNGKLILIINRDVIAEYPLYMFLGDLEINSVYNSSNNQVIRNIVVKHTRPVALKDIIGKDVIYVTEKDKVFLRLMLGADGLPDPVADYCLQCNISLDQMPQDCGCTEGSCPCPYKNDIILEAGIVARVTRAKIA